MSNTANENQKIEFDAATELKEILRSQMEIEDSIRKIATKINEVSEKSANIVSKYGTRIINNDTPYQVDYKGRFKLYEIHCCGNIYWLEKIDYFKVIK